MITKWLEAVKHFAWIFLVIFLVAFVWSFWHGSVLDARAKESQAQAAAAEKALVDYKAVSDPEIAKQKQIAAAAEAERQRILEELKAAQMEKARMQAALAAKQAETRALPDDTLTANINSRIGDELSLLAAGKFSLSRTGAENTWNIFLKASSLEAQLVVDAEAIEKALGADRKSQEKAAGLERALGQTAVQLEKALAADAACQKAVKDIARAARIGKWKARGEGLVAGVVVGFVVKSLILSKS